MNADALLADKACDIDAIIKYTIPAKMDAVIPLKRNRKIQREYDKDLYKLRHLAGNAFLILKEWRGIAVGYVKKAASFFAAVQIRNIAIWATIH